VVDVRIVKPTLAGVRGAMERVFAAVGLPGAIRSDNGAPFGSTGAGGLSALSVWWLKLGIEPRYIPPSSSAACAAPRCCGNADDTETLSIARQFGSGATI
jgi:hypothetical protein